MRLIEIYFLNNSTKISYSDLIKLVKILQQKGARIRLPRDTPQLSAIQRKLWAIWKAVADERTSAALNTYVKRYYAEVADWRELDSEQVVSIVEQLKQWKKRIGR